jgi:hypothetical protein
MIWNVGCIDQRNVALDLVRIPPMPANKSIKVKPPEASVRARIGSISLRAA